MAEDFIDPEFHEIGGAHFEYESDYEIDYAELNEEIKDLYDQDEEDTSCNGV